MLATAPPYLPQFLRDSNVGIFHSSSFRFFSNISFLYSRKKCPETRFSVTAAFTRKPTGTPGAYQLIDEDTGEKFIVWGGVENDDDSLIPSKEVLSWKPGKGVQPTISAAKSDDSPVTRTGVTAASFGRLKAQNVRAHIKKSSRIRKENTNNNWELHLEDMPSDIDNSALEVEFGAKTTNMHMLGHDGNLSRGAGKQEAKHTMRHSKIIKDTSYEFEQLTYDKVRSSEPHGHDSRVRELNVSSSRAKSSLRGWSSSTPAQSMGVDSRGLLKQQKKLHSDGGFFSRKAFKDLGCSQDMIEALRAQLFHHPSHIQAMSYKPVLEGKSCIIADQSGSGKTLAYLAPVIQRLRQEELQGLGKPSSRSPQVVVLVPTAELASQVLNNCRAIAKSGVPFRSMVATGGFRQKTQLDNLQDNIDVLIATPGRFSFLFQNGFLELTNLKCVVLDEVDILFGDEGVEQVLKSLINSGPVTSQYLFVTATLPVDIYNKLVEVFPDCEVVTGPGMHRTSSGLEEVLVDCSGDDEQERTPDTAFLNKRSALLQLVQENPVPKTIVFCNKIETCRKVENVLRRFDRKGFRIHVLPFHAALAQDNRLANMEEFLKMQLKDSMFLICTDRASRGIDFPNVDHVILFDFPRDPSEYVRRVGRTARGAGGKGKTFAFVVGKQVSLARRIMERNRKGHPLHDVPSAYELTRY